MKKFLSVITIALLTFSAIALSASSSEAVTTKTRRFSCDSSVRIYADVKLQVKGSTRKLINVRMSAQNGRTVNASGNYRAFRPNDSVKFPSKTGTAFNWTKDGRAFHGSDDGATVVIDAKIPGSRVCHIIESV